MNEQIQKLRSTILKCARLRAKELWEIRFEPYQLQTRVGMWGTKRESGPNTFFGRWINGEFINFEKIESVELAMVFLRHYPTIRAAVIQAAQERVEELQSVVDETTRQAACEYAYAL